jgi:uncharacterized membrane protein
MTEHLDFPVDPVFELATDFKRYPEWNVNYSEIREVVGPPLAIGTRVHAVMRVLGRAMEGWGEIVEVEAPRYLKFKSTGPDGGSNTTAYRFTPEGNGTEAEVELEYELPAGIVGQIADRLFVERAVERDMRHSIENFKALLLVREPVHA